MKWIFLLALTFGLLGCGASDGVSLTKDVSSQIPGAPNPQPTPSPTPSPTPATYQVTYSGNSHTSGTVPVDGTSYDGGDTVTVLANSGTLLRTGMTFTGWNTAANGSGTSYLANATFSISADTTLYAQWTANNYSVTYLGNAATSGTAPTDVNSPYSYGSMVTVLANLGNLVKSGQTFVGWNTAADGSGTSYTPASTFAMTDSNISLYANWKSGHLVTYDGNGSSGGNVPNDTNSPYAAGATVTVLANPGNLSRGGYTFNGWNTASDGTGTNRAAGSTFTMPASSSVLYARWALRTTYSVTYQGNGNDSGTVPVDSSSYWQGADVPVFTNIGSLTKSGFTFSGWSIVSDSSQHAVGENFYMPAANVVLRAQWVANGRYSLIYNGNGHSGGTAPVDAGSPFVSGANITVSGNSGNLTRGSDTFLGWNTASNGTGIDYAPGATFALSGHTYLYARWTSKYTVSFNANGGAGSMSSQSIAAGTSANLTSNAFTRSGYVFTGWATAASGSVIYNDQQRYPMGTSNTTLYAKWVLSSSLQIHYNFNIRNATDSSGNNKHGTANNLTYVPDGSGTYAVQFNGTNSHVVVPNQAVQGSPNFTVMMRFKASPSQQGSLFGYQNKPAGDMTADQHVPMIVVRSDGRLYGELWTTLPGGGGAALAVISPNAVNDGSWHTVYFSSDGTTIKLFLDGILLGQASGSTNHLLMYYNQIGTSRAQGRTLMPNANTAQNQWYYFNGLIDDFYLYNTAL